MSTARHHAEWLSLTEISGPFLSMPVLTQAFPQGLDKHDPDHTRLLRQAFEEWDDNQSSGRPDPAIHNAWIRYVLANTLDLEEVLLEGQAIPQTLKAAIAEQRETLRPDCVVKDPGNGKPRLLVRVYPRTQKLTKPVAQARWKASPDTRMMELLHRTDVRLGLVTNGDQWMLVDAPGGETTGYASWYSSLWFEEPITLRAFRTLLCATRFFGVAEDETPESLLARSAADQQEVTDQLGYQVRRAVEVIVQTLDKADQTHERELLGDIPEEVLYEAALTVMMRLVFLFCAEERELLLLGDELYDKNYAVSTLREQLQETADQFGEEILERRKDAWNRLLTTFRAVYGGVEHDRFRMPAYGGNLFDPDRFPFLEGRKQGTSWRDEPANPLPVDNRTVLHLLQALQILEVKMPGRGPVEAQRLSFRALGIEQIGHVYEGLLDHTAVRATEPVLGLSGSRDHEPEIPLSELERLRDKDETKFHEYLKKETGRSSVATIKRALDAEVDGQLASKFRTVCHGDGELWKRIEPFAGLVRTDTFGYPVVIPNGSVYVTAGTDRRSSGTHYTPRSLTEPIIQYTLEPLVYDGPAEGKRKEEWKLRSPAELLELNICDMACGSGAFLVQTCRYLGERLVEAWEEVEKQKPDVPGITPEGKASEGKPEETLIPKDTDERIIYAQRLIASRCIYGVDKNHLAAEMAKLSLWLLTLQKDKPFTFLDHAIRCGDSLVGLHDLEQLRHYSLKPDADDAVLFKGPLETAVDEAISLRIKLEDMPANTVEDVKAQERLLGEAEDKIARLRCAADMLVTAEFWGENAKHKQELVRHAAVVSGHYIEKGPTEEFEQKAAKERRGQKMFHWPLEFPEVIVKRSGFDAFVGNPPFLGGRRIRRTLGYEYLQWLTESAFPKSSANADLCAFFFLQIAGLLSKHGACGLLATNTIGQGDTRETGLEQVLNSGLSIIRAISSAKWPGTANLEVAQVWLRNGEWNGTFVLGDHQGVKGITSYLARPADICGTPHRLTSNAGRSYQGSILVGTGFVLTSEEAQQLMSADERNSDVLFKYLNGQDLNTRFDQSPSRWVVNFFDWPLDKDSSPLGYSGPTASDYPACLSIIDERVKPQRIRKKSSGEFALRRPLPQKWWHYGDKRPALYEAINSAERVLVVGQTSKYHSFVVVPASYVYDQKLIVFPGASHSDFCCLSASFHTLWILTFGSSLETRPVYTPSDCFDTFPFPVNDVKDSRKHGTQYHEFRRQIMLDREEGLTKTYNCFHNPDDTSEDIQKLRELHTEMDNAVAAAYGWTDLDLGHGFHETKQGLRYTISEDARREVLGRLLKLNHERYEEEVKQGLHDKKKKTTRKRTAKKKPKGPALF